MPIIGLVGVVICGCGPFVEVIQVDPETAIKLRAEVPTVSRSELGSIEFDSLGTITATSCFSNFITDDPASQDDALDQLRYKASGIGANALFAPACRSEGTSLATNCWSSITCTAEALYVRERQPQEAPSVASKGTCFVVNPEGDLLTNAHVVTDAEQIFVTLIDDRRLPARIKSISRSTDIALISVDASNLAYLPLASSRSVSIGAKVFTLGFPAIDILGAEPKFTDGAVSSFSGLGGESTLMQITVPVQPGNSGGPLVTEGGYVIGIVTSTAAVRNFYRETGTLPQNINWAVKSDYASPLFEAPAATSAAVSREDAIDRARNALCHVEVVR